MIKNSRRQLMLGIVGLAAERLALGHGSQQSTVSHGDVSTPADAARKPHVSAATDPSDRRHDESLLLWDGVSGVTGRHFNAGALLPWSNLGGDWLDRTGLAQGPTPLASLASNVAGTFGADVTELVRGWYAAGNSGALLKAAGAAVVGLRRHADASKRPTLRLVDDNGATRIVPCSANGVLDVSTASAIGGDSATIGAGKNLALQFELPRPEPRFVSARLELTSLHNYSVPLTLQVYRLNSPRIFSQGEPVLGLAAAYPGDLGIEKAADVYFTGFDRGSFPEGGFAADTSAHKDLDFPSAVNGIYRPGSFSAGTMLHRWSTKRANQRTRNPDNGLLVRAEIPSVQYLAKANADCPGELYFRYYLKLAADFHCAVSGKKLPGLAGRYGTWTGDDRFGYYNPQTGNGGAPTTGDFDGKGLNGWSMRHHAHAAPSDANPYGKLIPLNYYAYFVGMGKDFGVAWRWGNARQGYVNIEAGRWYCVEHYVKVNDIQAPFDGNGNGSPVANGVVQGWLDGVLVFEKRDVVLRKHPAIRIDEVWLDHYHGGTVPAEAEHRFSMANLVVARKYIGPRVARAAVSLSPGPATPRWLANKPTNHWIAIPGSALSESKDLSAQIEAGLCSPSGEPTQYGRPRKGIFDFSGGAVRRAGSEILVFGGGGAGAWAGNDVRSLRLEEATPTWRTVIRPSPSSEVWPRSATQTAHPYLKNGAPNARHSYWQPQFIDGLDTFMTFGCQNVWEVDSGTFNTVDSAPYGGRWSPAGTHPDLPAKRGYDGSWVCKDSRNDNVYAASANAIHRFDPRANTWSTVLSDSRADGIERGCAAIDSTRGLLLRIGRWGADNHRPVTVDLQSGKVTVAKFVGEFASSIVNTWAAGFVFDPLLDKFLIFVDDGNLYSISHVGDEEWQVARLATTGQAPPPRGSTVHSGGPCAVWGRMQYVPNLKGLCILQRFDRPAYFIRTVS